MSQLPLSNHDLTPHIQSPSRLRWTRFHLVACIVLFLLFQPWFPWTPVPAVKKTSSQPQLYEAERAVYRASPPPLLQQNAIQLEREIAVVKNLELQPQSRIVTEDHKAVTAVLLYVNQPASLKVQLAHLQRVPWIREVLIWNDGSNNVLNTSYDDNMPNIRVFNAPGPSGELGYFYACALASHDTCLVQDLNTINPALDTLYLKHAEQPLTRLTAAVTSSELHQLKHLHFQNKDAADLHTGVSWLRSALVAKASATRFLNQIATSPVALPSRVMLTHASLWFGLWTNTFPDLLDIELQWLDVEGPPPTEIWSREHTLPVLQSAITLLFDNLALQDPSYIPYPFPIRLSPPAHDARAITPDGSALFLSSQSPFPSPSLLVLPRKQQVEAPQKRPLLISTAQDALSLSFDPHVDLAKGLGHFTETLDRLKVGRDQLFPNTEDWNTSYNWALAVDGDDSTCWTTRKPPRVSDHFGLHWTTPRTVDQVRLLGSQDLMHVLSMDDEDLKDNSWALQLLLPESEEWQPAAFELNSHGIEEDRIDVKLKLKEPILASKLRFISTDAKTAPLVLCELSVT